MKFTLIGVTTDGEEVLLLGRFEGGGPPQEIYVASSDPKIIRSVAEQMIELIPTVESGSEKRAKDTLAKLVAEREAHDQKIAEAEAAVAKIEAKKAAPVGEVKATKK